ncbi:hypothetical protein [Sphingobium indicum]|uniref:hypothetical protein n=1 Tax=Sphingobium indicum TaxID=332055 RepID=UPI000568104F|nr:hypothetical protein [Sphingobium indicum]
MPKLLLFKARIRGAIERSARTRLLFAVGLLCTLIGLISGLQQMLSLDNRAVPYFRGTGIIAASLITVCLIFWALHFLWSTTKVAPMELSIPPSRFACRVLDTYADSQELNTTAVAELFSDVTPSLEVALEAQKINNRRLVGIIEKSTDTIAGWVAMWPVRAKTGRDIEWGKVADDSIPLDQLLRESENSQARYLVILALGIREQYRCLPDQLFPKLANATLWHIHDTFYANEEKRLTILAVAYTKEGEKMCRMLGLRANGATTNYTNGEAEKPIFAGSFSRADIRDKLRSANS